MKNLTLENITAACRGTYHGDKSKLSQEVAGVVIDSRKVEKDYLFVAIDGERFNAHQFIPDTIEKGALCVVSHEDLGETDFPYILVESTGQALLDIAKLYRDSFDVKVVGIGVLRLFVKNLPGVNDVIQHTALLGEQLVEGVAVEGALRHPENMLCLESRQQIAHRLGG